MIYLFIIGVISAIVNILAGNGTIFTFLTLLFLGEDASIANGTNRLGAAAQSPIGLWRYHKKDLVKELLPRTLPFIFPTLLGVMIGSLVVVKIPTLIFELCVGVILVLILILLVLQPQKWLGKSKFKPIEYWWFSPILFFLIGFYSGFIQIGLGLVLIIGLVMQGGFSLPEANVAKLILVVLFTIPSLLIFIINHQIHYFYGIILFFSQAVGSFIGAEINVRHSKAKGIAYFLMIVMTIVGIIRLLFY